MRGTMPGQPIPAEVIRAAAGAMERHCDNIGEPMPSRALAVAMAADALDAAAPALRAQGATAALLAIADELDREAISVRAEPSLTRDHAIWSAAGYQNAGQLARKRAKEATGAVPEGGGEK